MKISLIILCYNDGEALPILVDEFNSIRPDFEDSELIIVDDCSTDHSKMIIEELCQKYSFVSCVLHKQNTGAGGGFISGIQVAKFDWIGYTDGDAQYFPDDLKYFKKTAETADVITGNRIHRADPKIRTVVSAFYNFFIRHRYQIPVADINSGLKLYSRKVLDAILPISSNGPFYDAEMLIKTHRAGFRIQELPIKHRPRKFGQAQGASMKSIKRTIGEFSTPVALALEKPDFWGHLFGFVRLFK